MTARSAQTGRRTRGLRAAVSSLIILVTTGAAWAQTPADSVTVKLGTTIFTEFAYQGEPRVTDADKNAVRKSEFEVRRAYVNLTGSYLDLCSFRVTPDVAARQSTSFSGSGLPGDFKGGTNLDGSLTVRLKYAFGQVNLDRLGASGKGAWIRFGQQPTPYFDFMEGIYRYRFQGTLFVERQGLLSSSDVGLSGRYNLPGGYGDVHLGVYNGETYTKPEVNGRKAVQLRGSLRPLPRHRLLKGFRVHAFLAQDAPVDGAARNRFVADATFEHPKVTVGFDRASTRDRTSGLPGTTDVRARGWSLWVIPRTTFGVEGLFRYDHFQPDASKKARKREVVAGVAYWLPVLKAPQAVAVLADYDGIDYDAALNRPSEKRWELKALLSF